MAQQTWEEFDHQYELIRKFGLAAVQAQLNAKMKEKGQTARLSQNDVLDAIGVAVAPYLDNALEKELVKVQHGLEQQQTPRADNRPDVTNRNILGDNLGLAQQAQSLKSPPWAAKMDLAADPKVSDALNNLANPSNQTPRALTDQFNMVMDKLEVNLREQYQNKLKAKMAMAPRPGAPRPKPE